MIRRLVCACAAVVCLVAYAAYAIPEELSVFTVIMKYGGAPLGGIHIAVCRVADMRETPGGIVYTAALEFGGAGADFAGFSELTGENITALASGLDAYADGNGTLRLHMVTDEEGKAVFAGLPAGLYLAAQPKGSGGGYVIAPYFVAVPVLREGGGGWDHEVVAYPKAEPAKEPAKKTRPPGKVNISGSKTWYHRVRDTYDYITEDEKPRSITLIVRADGEVVLKTTVTAADRWSWDLELDRYGPDGREIVYTVDEGRIDDYRKWVRGHSLINEYSPGDNTEGINDAEIPLYAPDDGPDGVLDTFPDDGCDGLPDCEPGGLRLIHDAKSAAVVGTAEAYNTDNPDGPKTGDGIIWFWAAAMVCGAATFLFFWGVRGKNTAP